MVAGLGGQWPREVAANRKSRAPLNRHEAAAGLNNQA
jgi:hypothetical protein